MIPLSRTVRLKIRNGGVKKITQKNTGTVLWKKRFYTYNYVSFGDSIAAGHAINNDWEKNYGTGSQYGKNGNTETVIVPGCYTDLLHKDLKQYYVADAKATSYAVSGDKVDDLIIILNDQKARNSVANADIVTLCIGANNVLEPALSHLEEYIYAGDSALQEIAAIVEANLAELNDDSNQNSYRALFDKLYAINPNARYVFMTIYNPYKYLWLDEGANGFFAPMLNTIPQITILGFEVDKLIKEQLLSADIVRTLYSRVNGLCNWAENYVTRLNTVLRNKISAYGKSNFLLTDVKALFDTFPDRPISATRHYNDLVNVEYTRGYNTAQMDWGKLWEGSNAGTFWLNLATKYVSFSGIDINGFANELIPQIVEKVITPDIDPHPEEYGHYVLKRSFEDALGIQALDRYTITYNANGASGSMATQTILGVDRLPAFTNIRTPSFSPATGYYFTGWNTAANGSGTKYNVGQLVGITSNITLYAQWSNLYSVAYMHTNHTGGLYGDNETGHMECYGLYINGALMPKLGKFSDNNRPIYRVPYGSTIRVVVSNYNPSEIFYDDINCDVYWNGTSIRKGYRGTEYTFTLTGNISVDFRWKIAGSLATFNAQSWEDCYITTQ